MPSIRRITGQHLAGYACTRRCDSCIPHLKPESKFCVQLIYSGLVGEQSSALIEYLEEIPGVQPIGPGENPATWMLEVTGGASVTGKSKAAKVDFAEYYKVSHLTD
jgi:hypothetical protein